MNTQATPPSFPRPSSSLAKSRLRGRLQCSPMSNGPMKGPHALAKDSVVKKDKEFAGIGESQFDRFDRFEDDEEIGNDQVSMLRRSSIESSMAGLSLKRKTMDPSVNQEPVVQQSSVRPFSASTQHTTVALPVPTNPKWDRIATSLASGRTEFCYMEELEDNTYKFTFTKTPRTKNYATLSRNGIVRLHDGVAEKINFETFMTEHLIYSKLKCMRIFGLFRQWKTFFVWHRMVLRQKFNRSAAEVEKLLSQIMVTLKDAYNFVYKKCFDLRRIRVLKFSEDEVVDLEEFSQSLAELRVEGAAQRSEMLASISSYLLLLGESYVLLGIEDLPDWVPMSYFKANSSMMSSVISASAAAKSSRQRPNFSASIGIPEASLGDPFRQQGSQFQSTSVFNELSQFSSGEMLGSQSIAMKAMPTRLSYAQRSAIRINCRRYFRFIRWVDFMIRDACYMNIELSLGRFALFLCGMNHHGNAAGDIEISPILDRSSDQPLISTRPSIALFRIEMRLRIQTSINSENSSLPSDDNVSNTDSSDSSAIMLHPKCEDMESILAGLLSSTVAFAEHSTSLVSPDKCGDVFTPIEDEIAGVTLEKLIELDSDNSLLKLKEFCMETLRADLRKCKSVMQSHKTFILTMADNCTAFLANYNVAKLSTITVDDITRQLQEFDELKSQLALIPESMDLGIVRLYIDSVQQRLALLLKECVSLLHKLIPEYFVVLAEQFTVALSIILRSLEEPPENLNQFIVKVEIFKSASENIEIYRTKFNLICGIRDILETFSIAHKPLIPLINSTLLVWSHYNDVINDFAEKLESRTKQFKNDLKSRARVLLAPLESAKLFAISDFVKNPDSDPSDVLKELRKYREEMEAVRTESMIIEKYQDVMNVKVFKVDPVIEIIGELTRFNAQWEVMKLVKFMQIELLQSKFMDLSCEEMYREIRIAASSATALVAEAGSNLVLAWLKEAIDDLQIAIPVIFMLQAPTLKDRHTTAIHEILGRNIFSELDITVSNLIANGLNNYRLEIQRVYERSCYEKNIEVKMQSIRQECDAKILDIATDKENKNIVFFAGLEDSIIFFEDHLLSADGMIRSTFSAPFSADLTALHQTVATAVQVCKDLQYLQQKFLLFRVLFSSARTARHLNHCIHFFKILDEGWRNIIKTGRAIGTVQSIACNDVMLDYLRQSIHAANDLERSIKHYLQTQRDKWPKLYLMSDEALLNAFATLEPHSTFKQCRVLLPGLTDLIFDKTDVNSAVAGVSGEEIIELTRPCSARTSLIDWLQGIDAVLGERLQIDIRDNFEASKSFLEDIRSTKISLQSKVCALQAKFWMEFQKFMINQKQLRLYLTDIGDKFTLAYSTRHSLSNKRELLNLHNILLVLIDQRDMVTALMREEEAGIDVRYSFGLDCKLKKYYNPANCSINVQCGYFKSLYGMKYHGFRFRMIITPLTERFYLSLTIAALDSNGFGIPIVTGKAGIYKAQMIEHFGHEFGCEVVTQDCSFVWSIQHAQRLIQAAFATNLWLTFSNLEKISKPLLAEVLTSLSIARQALLTKKKLQFPGSNPVGQSSSTLALFPRFCLVLGCDAQQQLNGSAIDFMNKMPDSARNTFRPMQCQLPRLDVIIRILLAVSNFPHITILTPRLDAFCQHLIVNAHIPEDVVWRVMFQCIRSAGTELVILAETSSSILAQTPVGLKQQTELIISHLLRTIQSHLITQLSEVDLRYSCSMFLEIPFGEKELIATSDNCPRDNLLQVLQSKRARAGSIIVLGSCGSGKTTLIKDTFKYLVDHNPKIKGSTSHESSSTSNQKQESLQFYASYPRVLSPWAMQCSTSPLDCIASLTESIREDYLHHVEKNFNTTDKLLHLVHIDTNSSFALSQLVGLIDYPALHKHNSDACIVWETVEICNLDPSQAFDLPIVQITGCTFSEEDLMSHWIDRLSQRDGTAVRDVLTSCIELYGNPCLSQIPSNSCRRIVDIIDSLFRVFELIFRASGLIYGSSGLWDEASIRRIFIYSCIWSIGLSTVAIKDGFDTWFKEFFDKPFYQASPLGGSRIFPILCPQCSIFDSVLQPVEEGDVRLEWIVWDQGVRNRVLAETAGSLAKSKWNFKAYSSQLPDQQSQSSLLHSHLAFTTAAVCGPKVLVPTQAGVTLRFLQNCILSSANHEHSTNVLVAGSAYSGKTSVIRHLSLNPAASTQSRPSGLHSTNHSTIEELSLTTRWICIQNDGDPMAFRNNILRSKHLHSPHLICSDLPNLGAVFIDDLNISNHADDGTTSSHFLRQYLEFYEFFNSDRKIWEVCRGQYNFCTASSSSCTNTQLLAQSGMEFPNRNYNNRLNERLLRHFVVFCLSPTDLNSVFVKLFRQQCPILPEDICEDLVSITYKLVQSLRCKNSLYVQNSNTSIEPSSESKAAGSSAASYGRRQTTSGNLLGTVVDAGAITKLPLKKQVLETFHQMLQLRPIMTTVAQIIGPVQAALSKMTAYTTVDAIRVWERVVSDYMPLDNEIMCTLDNTLVEVLSESLFKFPTFGDVLLRERTKHLALLSSNSGGGSFVVGYSSNMPGGFIGVHHPDFIRDTFRAHHTGVANSDDSVIDKNSSEFWYSAQKLCVQILAPLNTQGRCPAFMATGASKTLVNDIVSAAALMINSQVEVITLIPDVSHVSSDTNLALNSISSSISQRLISFINRLNPQQLAQDAQEIINSFLGEPDAEESLSKICAKESCVYHVHISGECLLDRKFWSELELILTCYASLVQSNVFGKHSFLLQSCQNCRKVVTQFVAKQYFVFSFDFPEYLSHTLMPGGWAAAPPVLSECRLIDFNAPYCDVFYGLKKIIGPDLYEIAATLLDKITDAVVGMLNKKASYGHKKDHLLGEKILSSPEFKASSFEILMRLCKIAISYEEEWKEAMTNYLHQINGSSHISIDQNSVSEDVSLRKSTKDIIIRDCILSIVFSRYFSLLSDDDQSHMLPVISSIFSELSFDTVPTDIVFVETFLLAASMAFQLFKKMNTADSNLSVVGNAASIREGVSLRRLSTIRSNGQSGRVGNVAYQPEGTSSGNGHSKTIPTRRINELIETALLIPAKRPLRKFLGMFILGLISADSSDDSEGTEFDRICLLDKTVMATLLVEDVFGLECQELFQALPARTVGCNFSIISKVLSSDQSNPSAQDTKREYQLEYALGMTVLKLRSSSGIVSDLFLLSLLLKKVPLSRSFTDLWLIHKKLVSERFHFAQGNATNVHYASHHSHSELASNYMLSFTSEENERYQQHCILVEDGWNNLVREIEKPLRVLKAMLQSFELVLQTSSGIRPTWEEFGKLLEVAIESGEYESGKLLAAETVFAILERTKARISPRQGLMLDTAIAFQMHFDNTDTMKQIIPKAVEVSRVQALAPKGITVIRSITTNRVEDDEDDDKPIDEDEEDGDEIDVDKLSERTKTILTNVLSLLHSESGPTSGGRRANINSIALITLNLPQWVAWASHPANVEMPLSGYHNFSMPEKFFIAAELKPIAVIEILQHEIIEVGLGLSRKHISLFADHLVALQLNQPESNRARANSSFSLPESENAAPHEIASSITKAPIKKVEPGLLHLVNNADGTFNVTFPLDISNKTGEDASVIHVYWNEMDAKSLVSLKNLIYHRREQIAVQSEFTKSKVGTHTEDALNRRVERQASVLVTSKIGMGATVEGQRIFPPNLNPAESTNESKDRIRKSSVAFTGMTEQTEPGNAVAVGPETLNVVKRDYNHIPLCVHVTCMSTQFEGSILTALCKLVARLRLYCFLEMNYFVSVPRKITEIFGLAIPEQLRDDSMQELPLQIPCSDILPSAALTMDAECLESEDGDEILKVQSIHHASFVSILQRCLAIVRSCCSRQSDSSFAHIFWLLCLCHTAILVKLGAVSPQIGDEMLRSAVAVVMGLFDSSATIRTQFLEADESSIHVPGNFIAYLVELVYCRAVDSEMKRACIWAIFNSFFTPGSTNSQTPYYIRGLLQIPSGLSWSDEADFTAALKVALDDQLSITEFLATTNAQRNTRAYHEVSCVLNAMSIYDATKGAAVVDNIPKHARLVCLGGSDYLRMCMPFFSMYSLQRVQKPLLVLKQLLPEKIALNTPRLIDKMTEKTLLHQEKLKHSGRKREGTVNHLHHHKKAASKIQINREFDPLWAYVLSETIAYNRDIEYVTKMLNQLTSSTCTVQQFLANANIFIPEGEIISAENFGLVRAMFENLDRHFVPNLWLSLTALSHTHQNNLTYVSFSDWVKQLEDRRSMLMQWLTDGYPTIVKLHLLTNPASLIHCMKEYYSMKNNVSIDKLHAQAQVIELKQLDGIDIHRAYLERMSCAVVATDIEIHNATFSSGTMVFCAQHSANSFGQSVALVIDIANTIDIHDEEYECPLFVTSDYPSVDTLSVLRPIITAADDSVASTAAPLGQRPMTSSPHSYETAVGTAKVYISVPIPTIEDIEDCRSYGVVMYSCPYWLLPTF